MLSALLADTLDPAYAAAAARRGPGGRPRRSRQIGPVVAALLALGLVLGVAYADTRAGAPSGERTRLALVADVRRDSARAAGLQRGLERVRTDVAAAIDAELAATQQGRTQTELVARLEQATGVIAVVGPGVVVTVSDAEPEPAVDPVTGEETTAVPEAGTVLDLDLQAVVNALWEAGAEAIAVNGQRLAPTSSIRTAGAAILVDFRPVTSPYGVAAVGNPDLLLPRFAGSQTAARYDAYRQLYGIGFELAPAQRLTLPAAPDIDLRFAVPADPAATPGEVPGETK